MLICLVNDDYSISNTMIRKFSDFLIPNYTELNDNKCIYLKILICY